MSQDDAFVTVLTTENIGSVDDALMALGNIKTNSRTKERTVPLVLMPQRDGCTPWLKIPEGVYAVISSHGRFIGIWPAGFHWAKPWERASHLVSKQSITFDTPIKACPTSDNVMVEIDVAIVFRIKPDQDAVQKFVYSLGPKRLTQMLTAFGEEGVRIMARKKSYAEIYDLMDTEEFEKHGDSDSDDDEVKRQSRQTGSSTTGAGTSSATNMPVGAVEMSSVAIRSKKAAEKKQDVESDDEFDHHDQLENTKRDMNKRLVAFGVEVSSITITNVRLPDNFAAEMEQATTWSVRNKFADLKQKYDLTVVNDRERQAQLRQKLDEDQEEEKASFQAAQADEKRKNDLIQAQIQQVVAEVEETAKADVREIETTSELRVAELNKKRDITKATIEANTAAAIQKIKAETDAFIARTTAETKLKVAQNRAEVLRLQARAEETAAAKLKAKRQYDQELQRLRVLKNLAGNEQVVLSGDNSSSMLAQLSAARQSAQVLNSSV
eukprot:TRINITY_DN66660_c7_g11_i1.p1 TRINITY_DN66660_c7_g11~~TRINITY_DN66660_c7_g11_i1.p1  ORF type:complete len:495 (-),score=285.72 TRINITY_DN66660_c7_g11_i1:63-1547(-)